MPIVKPETRNPKALRPPVLQPGDTVGIVAPASVIDRSLLEAGCDSLRRLGYKPVYQETIFDQDLYFAGSVQRRARELEDMFERDDVRAIICARGGYGCNYLLSEIDIEKIRRNPKVFVGYSDVTSLLTWFTDAAGLVTFHGPMVTKDFGRESGVHVDSWRHAVSGGAAWELIEGTSGIQALVDGTGEGELYGGCLSMLAASLGTPYEIQTAGRILFIEDVGTKPYQVDRMLMQLKLAGKLADLRGIVFGEMLDCVQAPGQGYTLQDVVKRVLGTLGVPVAFGLRSGHVSRKNIALPLGVRTSLSVAAGSARLRILEPATQPTVRSVTP
jgi:muramoyltetrapeptide carboxypeptidase